jgi:hypothetical protein
MAAKAFVSILVGLMRPKSTVVKVCVEKTNNAEAHLGGFTMKR